MGADFVWTKADVTKPKSYWVELVDKMDEDDVSSFIDYFYDCDDWYEGDELSKSEEARVLLWESIEACYNYMNRADIGWEIVDDKTYILTGGLTWGDDPTESFVHVSMLSVLQYHTNPIQGVI
jgi:hypothetical protein